VHDKKPKNGLGKPRLPNLIGTKNSPEIQRLVSILYAKAGNWWHD
jgi:hypothetical protein